MLAMFFRTKAWPILVPLLILALAAGIVLLARPKSVAPGTTTNTTNPARDRYAAVYQAAWREGSLTGNILLTATLVPPPMTAALGADTERSDADDRLWRALDELTETQIPVLLTFDSVGGAIPDATIKASLSLKTTPGLEFGQPTWRPLIASSRLVNAPVGTSSQFGLAVFTATKAVDWDQLETAELMVASIDGQAPQRVTWTNVALLLDVQ